MADEIDRAQEREQAWLGNALRKQAIRAGFGGKTAADSALQCQQCDEPIASMRRHALPGVRLCVACQHTVERKGR